MEQQERTIILQPATSIVPGEIVVLNLGKTAAQVYEVRQYASLRRDGEGRIELKAVDMYGFKHTTTFGLSDQVLLMIPPELPACKRADEIRSGDLISFSHGMFEVTSALITPDPILKLDYVSIDGKKDFFLLQEWDLSREFHITPRLTALPPNIKRAQDLQAGDQFSIPLAQYSCDEDSQVYVVESVELQGNYVEIMPQGNIDALDLRRNVKFGISLEKDSLVEMPPPPPIIQPAQYCNFQLWMD